MPFFPCKKTRETNCFKCYFLVMKCQQWHKNMLLVRNIPPPEYNWMPSVIPSQIYCTMDANISGMKFEFKFNLDDEMSQVSKPKDWRSYSFLSLNIIDFKCNSKIKIAPLSPIFHACKSIVYSICWIHQSRGYFYSIL